MGKSVLVVAVRGWTTTGEWLLFGRPGGEFRSEIIDALQRGMPGAEVWNPDMEMGMFSMRSAESLSLDLFGKIEKKIATMPEVKSIVFLGYSAGSLLARRVFCMAHGADESGLVCRPATPWAEKIDRVVLLAGITRGWEFSSASPAHVRFLAPILQYVTLITGLLKRWGSKPEARIPLIWQLKRGSPFVVSTRIQYVNVFEFLRGRKSMGEASALRVAGLPSTVFLLGAKDEFLSPADCTELGPRSEFAFVEFEGCNHSEALAIAGESVQAVERRRRLISAIEFEFQELSRQSWAVPAADIDDYLDPMDISDGGSASAATGKSIDHAVIVVHGIRDNGFWTKRVAREIKTLGRRDGIDVRAPTPTYGYFSMWDFVKPGGREQATFWFLERYADIKSHFPSAKISFVGHSNGTYIAARAMMICPAIRFENIVFAGSVVRRDFRWSRFQGRVHSILNYVGSIDYVVAFLPAVFEYLRLSWLDVGGAGAFGFKEAEPNASVAKPMPGSGGKAIKLSEFRFIRGGHGAAIAEEFWPEIARFALYGTPPSRKPVSRANAREMIFRLAPAVTGIGVLVTVIALAMPLVVIAFAAKFQGFSTYDTVVAIALVSAGLFVSWVAGRFLRMW